MKGNARFAVAAAVLLLWPTAVLGAPRTWTGASISNPFPPKDNFWTNPFNWAGNAAPQPGDDLIFNGGPSSLNTFDAGTTFNTLTVSNHVIVAGNRVTLNAGLSASAAQISLSEITLNGHQAFTAPTAGLTAVITSNIDNNGNVLTLNGNGTLSLVGVIRGPGFLSKRGTGTAQLSGQNSYTGGTGADTGLLLINGSQPASAIDIEGGMLGGSGTVGPVGVRISPASVLPGGANNGTGILTVSGALTFATGGGKSLKIDLKGTTAGSGYDQVDVRGTVNLGGTSNELLVLLGDFTPAPGATFIIINNDGTDAVQGAFLSKPEGSFFTVANTTFAISYKGGDGNDVILHVPTTRTWDGGGSNNNWTTAANWAEDIAPAVGDNLIFPAGAARLSNSNDYPNGTAFRSITLSAAYFLSGNAIALHAGFTSDAPSGNVVAEFASIKLEADQTFTHNGNADFFMQSPIETNGRMLTLARSTQTPAEEAFTEAISGSGGFTMASSTFCRLDGGPRFTNPKTNTYTGPTVISAGILAVRCLQPSSPVQLMGGTLVGFGQVGPVTASGGKIHPADGVPRILSVAGHLNLTSSATLDISFGARSPEGVLSAGQLKVAGPVSLGNSALVVTNNSPRLGDQVTIIDNDGSDAVVGTFASLPEGGTFIFRDATIQISYRGGDGNDVTLHVIAVPVAAISLTKLTNGSDNNEPPGLQVAVGSTVTFTYVVTNSGSASLSVAGVRDDNGTPDNLSGDFSPTFTGGDTNGNGQLDVGESFTYTASRIATAGQHTNIGQVTAIAANPGITVRASDADNHFGVTPPSSLANISTRLRVQAGDNALFGGVIVTGATDKKVIVRAIGPSLANFGLQGVLQDPTLELFQGNQSIASNDNWVSSSQTAEIQSSGLAPGNNAESAIIATLMPNQNYTALVRGKDGQTGVGVVEVFDVDPAAPARLANISSRGFVDVDDNVMIAGLIVSPSGGTNINVLVRALGPTLGDFGVQGFLANPTLDLVSSNGTVIRSNQDWQDSQRTEIQTAQLAPPHDAEAALIESLAPGAYTAVVRGLNRTTGVGLVEVYNIP